MKVFISNPRTAAMAGLHLALPFAGILLLLILGIELYPGPNALKPHRQALATQGWLSNLPRIT